MKCERVNFNGSGLINSCHLPRKAEFSDQQICHRLLQPSCRLSILVCFRNI